MSSAPLAAVSFRFALRRIAAKRARARARSPLSTNERRVVIRRSSRRWDALPRRRGMRSATARDNVDAEPPTRSRSRTPSGTDSAQWLPPHFRPRGSRDTPPRSACSRGGRTSPRRDRRGDRYRVELYRLGWYGGSGARLARLPSRLCERQVPGRASDRDRRPRHRRGPRRLAGDRRRSSRPSTSGYYHARPPAHVPGATTRALSDTSRSSCASPPRRQSQILVQVATNTWQAYNPWGGKSLYPFNSTDRTPAVRVSFDRPLAFTAQGPFEWEYNLVRFLEREGYDVSYQADIDTDRHPESFSPIVSSSSPVTTSTGRS